MGVWYSDSIIHSFSICLPAEESSNVLLKYRVVVSSMYIELPFLRLEDVYSGNVIAMSGNHGGVPYFPVRCGGTHPPIASAEKKKIQGSISLVPSFSPKS